MQKHTKRIITLTPSADEVLTELCSDSNTSAFVENALWHVHAFRTKARELGVERQERGTVGRPPKKVATT